MDEDVKILYDQKVNTIREIVDTHIKNFAESLERKYTAEVKNPDGIINSKKNNAFIAGLGKEFMFYSAFVRSFDSSFGKVLENMGNAIAHLSFEVRGRIDSFLLPQQSQHIDYLLAEYDRRSVPSTDHYKTFTSVLPRDVTSYAKKHETDNYFYNPEKGIHNIIELKAGGDLDNKKSKAEKTELLQQYFLLKNLLEDSPEDIKIYFATAYNKFGEGNEWKQERVQQYFANEELLIGKDYWNFVCDDVNGFDIVYEQYQISSHYIIEALDRIKKLYFEE